MLNYDFTQVKLVFEGFNAIWKKIQNKRLWSEHPVLLAQNTAIFFRGGFRTLFSRGEFSKKSQILSTFFFVFGLIKLLIFRTPPEHYKDPILTKNFAPHAKL